MDFVFIDNDYYKITLEFTRDFIDNNFDEWIENNNKEEIKISRWEMMIYFKKLNDVSQDTIDYFLIDAVSKLTVISNGILINTLYPTKQKIEKCKNPVFIKIIILHRDTEFINTSNTNIINLRSFISFIFDHLNDTEYTKYYDKEIKIQELKEIFTFFNSKSSGTKLLFMKQPTFIDKVITTNSCEMECILVSMVKKHYREIIDNIEGYIIYCKTEKLKVDFNKIGRFINFIKEYVKSIYGFDLI